MTEDKEKKLFDETLKANSHLSTSHYPLLRAWCKLALRVNDISSTPTREDLRFIGELRLLSTTLKLVPAKAEDREIDLATQLQQGLHDKSD